ncbi:MAG: DUF5828 family protein [Thermoplasmata archaeon]
MSTDGIEFTNSGVKLKGDWGEVCDFAKGFENVIRKADARDKTVFHYRNWRPRENDTEEDIKEKTIDEAKVDVNGIKDMGIGKKVERMIKSEKEENIKYATTKAVRDIYVGSAKCFSKLEEIVYGKIMLRFNPYYFGEGEFSANLRIKDKKKCEMNVNFNDDVMRDKVRSIVKSSKWN